MTTANIDRKLSIKAAYIEKKYPELGPRYLRGIELYRLGAVRYESPGVFHVSSGTKLGEGYTVDLVDRTCTCPDFTSNRAPRVHGHRLCKHLVAAMLFTRNGHYNSDTITVQ